MRPGRVHPHKPVYGVTVLVDKLRAQLHSYDIYFNSRLLRVVAEEPFGPVYAAKAGTEVLLAVSITAVVSILVFVVILTVA